MHLSTALPWLLLTAAPAWALQATSLAPAGGGVRVVVTPEGAFLRASSDAPGATGTEEQTGGLVWVHSDGGQLWIGENVSIGNQGSEVFTEYTLNSEAAALLSVNDSNPPTPLWVSPSGATRDHHVASAEAASVHVAMHSTDPGGVTTVSKYSTGSPGAPDWTYTFATLTGGNSTGLGISRDGQKIVAGVTNTANWTAEIVVLGPGSNVPLSFTAVPVGVNGYLRGFDLSADGSTLYFSSGVTANVFDLATQTVVFSTNIGASFESHAISGDGSVFAFGNFNVMRVFRKVAGLYTNVHNRNVAGQNYCAQIDISDDSSTIAYGFYFYSPGLTVQIEALDVASLGVTMSEVITGTGTAQNVVGDVSISADGSRFAVGLWGDSGGVAHEARLYSRSQNTPLATLNLPGSVFGIAISADGSKMASASKAVHANTNGNGGRIHLYGKSSFTSFCAGDGSLGTACPCGNTGGTGRGCDNSIATGGALLSAAGSTGPDTLVLTSSGELPNALSIFLQGNASLPSGTVFGDGVRCVAGTLLRLYVKNASGGVVSAPAPGDPSVSAQSAFLGDPIAPGSTRWYQTYYRDPDLAFCPQPPGNSWNVSSGVVIPW